MPVTIEATPAACTRSSLLQKRLAWGLTWLSKKLGRAIAVPDMTNAGLTFIGGRLFFVNGMPVGQLAYHDEQGKLVGFCLMPIPSGDEKELTRSRNGDDLHLVDWHDQAYRYVLIGFDNPDRIERLGRWLSKAYRYEA